MNPVYLAVVCLCASALLLIILIQLWWVSGPAIPIRRPEDALNQLPTGQDIAQAAASDWSTAMLAGRISAVQAAVDDATARIKAARLDFHERSVLERDAVLARERAASTARIAAAQQRVATAALLNGTRPSTPTDAGAHPPRGARHER